MGWKRGGRRSLHGHEPTTVGCHEQLQTPTATHRPDHDPRWTAPRRPGCRPRLPARSNGSRWRSSADPRAPSWSDTTEERPGCRPAIAGVGGRGFSALAALLAGLVPAQAQGIRRPRQDLSPFPHRASPGGHQMPESRPIQTACPSSTARKAAAPLLLLRKRDAAALPPPGAVDLRPRTARIRSHVNTALKSASPVHRIQIFGCDDEPSRLLAAKRNRSSVPDGDRHPRRADQMLRNSLSAALARPTAAIHQPRRGSIAF